jgi:hypothetical protein
MKRQSRTQEYQAAVERGRRDRRRGLHALSATFDRPRRTILLQLTNGYLFGIPVERLREIRRASDDDLSEVELLGGGSVLHWEELDADYSVPALILSALRPRDIASHLGRAGGRVTSRAKARAARANGAKGGRPRLTG